MKRPPIHLDFVPRRGRSILGWLLLGSGLSALGIVVSTHQQLHREFTEIDSEDVRLAKLMPRLADKESPPRERAAREAEMRTIAKRLALPWGDFFNTLERVTRGNVVLMGIQPEGANGTIVIRGAAKSLYAMLDYVAALSAVDAFSGLRLTEHESAEQDAQFPVHFSIAGHWTREHVEHHPK